ncbi:uncharacterized protein TRUGW13939_07771 [Talaromyces rugulosus]|uniref:NACHT domain-containing protein n=1 Tax=Talaromyces rugulosus TaxID=121627 RepID=A0A7H8R4V4_TALRU|nr:uncharacterized protein TRUGW13939_07771 [Talaromyces rugulosus]QKX60625.1 hypothetical protein TRUGW13939_07771 [Talaromyces rugulosus]
MSFLKRFKTKRTKKKETLRSEDSPPVYSKLGPQDTEQIITNSTNAAFQEAWKMHWKELSESEKLAWSFQEVRSPLKVHKTIDDMDKYHRDQSVARKCAEGTLRFLRAIETLMAGVTIGMQAYPDVSSIVVGIVRVVINIAVKYFEYYEKLTGMLERLSDHLQVLDLFTRNKSEEPLLHSTLVAIYVNILAFCRYARRAFVDQGDIKRSNSFAMLAKVQWAPFEEQFGRIQSNLKHHTENLDRISAAITLNSTLEIREDVKKAPETAQNERREFLSWISTESIEEIHGMIRRKRLADTGSWLFEHLNYKKWALEEKVGPLWLFGPAGTGKSVLASMVIDHFSKNEDNVEVIHIYFKGEDTTIMRNSLVDVLSMLVKQLCWNIDVLPEQLLEFYRNSKRNARKPTSEDIKALFTECLNHVGKTVLVLDGLDEYEETKRKQLLNFISQTLAQRLNLKIFITSRLENDIKNVLHRCECLPIESVSQTRQDLVRVVKHHVTNELGHIEPEFQEEVIKLLIEKSGGIFLWVNFQLNDLTKIPEQSIRAQLNTLPSGLEETYLEYFRGINMQPQTVTTLAQRCFLWTFHTNARLTGSQLRDAVSLDLRISGNEQDLYSIDTLETVTKNLLNVPEFPFSRVRPVHFSLQEYATSSDSPPSDLREFLLPDSESANQQLAILCLEHLLADVPPRDFFDTILFYSAAYFETHIKRLKKIPGALIDLLDRILIKEKHMPLKILTWRWPITHETYPDISCMGCPKSVDPVFFMKCTGLDQIDVLWKRYSHLEQPTSYPDGYLHLAVAGRLEDTVKDMIAQGVEADQLDVTGRSPLYYGCDTGCPLEIVKLLVEEGANINLRTDDGKTPRKIAINFHVAKYLESIGGVEKKNGNPKENKETTPAERPQVYTSDWNPEQTEQVIAKTTNAAFLEAWRMHWMDLDESEKVEWSFQEVKSPLKVQKTIEDMDKLHREHSISRKVAAKTLRFFEALETLMSGVAIGIQSYPEVSAIVVGVVRVVINVAVKYFEYYEKLSQMLERLAEHIAIFDLFTQNNSDEQILHRIEQERRNFLDWICKYEIEEIHGIVREKRHPNTGLWLLDDRSYKSWILEKGTHPLWISGPAGTGKSVLASMVIDHLKDCTKYPDYTVAYMYFKGEEVDTKHLPSRVMSMLVKQLCWNLETLPERTLQFFRDFEKNARQHTFEDLSFLWVDLQLNDLVQIPQSDIENQLTMLPSGLSDTYIECLRRINAQPRANRLLAQTCFIWALYSYRLTGRSEFCDLVSLEAKLSEDKKGKYGWMEIEGATKQLIIAPGYWGRVRPLHFSFKEFILNPECPIPVDLQCYVPDSDTANARMAIMCLQHMMAENVPPGNILSTGLFYCGAYFDRHIRELATLPDELMDLLDQLFNNEPHKFLRILAWRWPLAHENYPDISCPGSPSSMDPVFFMQCTQLDKVPSIWSRYSNEHNPMLSVSNMEKHSSHSKFIHKLQSLDVDKKGCNLRSLAQNCFLWSLYAKKPITTAQLLDAVALDLKTSPKRTKGHEYFYTLTDLRNATCDLLLISGFGLNRVRPLDHDSERFICSAIHDDDTAIGLKEFFPSQREANIRLSSYCLQHLLADTPPEDSLFTILPYCASYFDAHIRSLDNKIPPNVLQLLEQLLNSGPLNLRKVISFRYPTTDESFPDVDCPGSPASIEPGFFLRCVNLHETVGPETWSRFAKREEDSYPEEYLHLAAVTGLTDIVASIISTAGVDINREDGIGFTALQYAVQAGQHGIVQILLDSGARVQGADGEHAAVINKKSTVKFTLKAKI